MSGSEEESLLMTLIHYNTRYMKLCYLLRAILQELCNGLSKDVQMLKQHAYFQTFAQSPREMCKQSDVCATAACTHSIVSSYLV